MINKISLGIKPKMNKEQPILKIRVGDRHYSDISFVRAKDLTPIDINITTSIVIRNKLFNQEKRLDWESKIGY